MFHAWRVRQTVPAGDAAINLARWQRGNGGNSLSSTLQDRRTLTPEQVRTLSTRRREALVIHATTPAVKVRMTRHYEGPHRGVFAASVREGWERSIGPRI